MKTIFKLLASGALGGNSQSLPDNAVIVLFSILQSNSNGRAEADRLQITTWPLRPVNSYYYVKGDYLSTDNGSFRSMWIGGPNYEEPSETARRMFASDAILTSKLRSLFGKDTPIYNINAAEGGTFTISKSPERDWQQASAECFDRAINGMYLPAIADIQAAHPTRQIKVIVLYHGGESEAIAGTSAVASFPAALQALYNSMNGVDSYLAAAPWLLTKVKYNADANETTINTHIDTFVSNNPTRAFVVDVSSYPRKVELTTEQKAGVSPTGTDDNHQSYIAQIAKADLHYPSVLTYHGWPNNDISELTNNTSFDPSSYVQSGKTGFRLQLNRGNMTVNGSGGTAGDENKITDVADGISAGRDWVVGGTVSGRLKVQARKGCFYFPIGSSNGDTRIVSPVALTNSIFNDGGFIWSVWGYVRFYPNSGSGGNPAQAILSTTDAYSGVRSNVLIYKLSTGELRCEVRCASSTVKIAETDLPVFNATANEGDQQFIHWCITSNGTTMKVFINGVDTALDATNNGSLSGITPSNFNNATNGIVLGQRQTAASTFDFGFMGEMREVGGVAGIALNASQVASLMLN